MEMVGRVSIGRLVGHLYIEGTLASRPDDNGIDSREVSGTLELRNPETVAPLFKEGEVQMESFRFSLYERSGCPNP